MKAKDLQINETKEALAIEVVTRVKAHLQECRDDLVIAEKKYAELLEKDVAEITKKDGQTWEW